MDQEELENYFATATSNDEEVLATTNANPPIIPQTVVIAPESITVACNEEVETTTNPNPPIFPSSQTLVAPELISVECNEEVGTTTVSNLSIIPQTVVAPESNTDELNDLTIVKAAPEQPPAPRPPSTREPSATRPSSTREPSAPRRPPSTRRRVKTTGEKLINPFVWQFQSCTTDCRLCVRSMYGPDQLRTHYKTHGIYLGKNYPLPKTKKDAKKLFRKFHPNECYICAKATEYNATASRFATYKELQEHKYRAHVPRRFRPFKCLCCEKKGFMKRFCYEKDLENHRLTCQ